MEREERGRREGRDEEEEEGGREVMRRREWMGKDEGIRGRDRRMGDSMRRVEELLSDTSYHSRHKKGCTAAEVEDDGEKSYTN